MTALLKRKVRVTIVKEIEIELTPATFGGLSQDEYLKEFRASLWDVESIDDVIEYAARMAATCGGGYTHDGLGLLDTRNSTYPRVPDTKFVELDGDIETEFVEP